MLHQTVTSNRVLQVVSRDAVVFTSLTTMGMTLRQAFTRQLLEITWHIAMRLWRSWVGVLLAKF